MPSDRMGKLQQLVRTRESFFEKISGMSHSSKKAKKFAINSFDRFSNEEFIVQSGSFVGSTTDLTLDTKWQGFTKGIFGSNLFMLKTVGTRKMFVNAWGGIVEKEPKSGERMLIDNYQLVALSSTGVSSNKTWKFQNYFVWRRIFSN